MKFNCIEKPLRKLFYHYGGLVASCPLIFLTIALLITALMTGGLSYLEYDKDTLNLLAPEDGRWKDEEHVARSIFEHLDDSSMLPNRLLEPGRYGGVMITGYDEEENMLEEEVLSEVIRFHNTVSNITVTEGGKHYKFTDLCLTWKGRCIQNSVLTYYDYDASKVSERILTYPFATLQNGFEVFTGADLGGVIPNREPGHLAEISKASIIRLFYFLRSDHPDDDRRSQIWEEEYAKVATQFESTIIHTTWSNSETLLEEVDKTISEVFGLWWVGIVLVVFCIGAASTNNWVQSQPMLCLMGMVAASMAILASFGLMGFIGVPYNILSGSVPFLILGISLDDTFIIIGSWRQTNTKKSVETRMKECLCESALSITITSLTDAVAFSIGIYSEFRAVQNFAKTSVSAIVLCYFFQLLFFAPCLVFSGKRQEQNRHCFTFRKVKPKGKADSKLYQIFCAGESVNENITGTPAMRFFRNYYAPFLNKWIVTIIVVIGYAAYLGTALWGYTLLEEGFQERNWVLDDSHLVNWYDLKDEYFTHFGPQVNVIANEEVDYWDPDIQQSIDDTLNQLEASQYTFESSKFTTAWLRDYLSYLKDTRRRANITEKDFMNILRNEFLIHPLYEQYKLDIVFNEKNDSIVASRFLIYTKDMTNKKLESSMMQEFRKIVDEPDDVPLIVYHANFVLFDQYLIMWPHTLHNLLIAGGAMFIIALFLIPHPICAVIVTASIASIIIGVLGYMSIWNIPLNHVSMVNLILCVGFSVDFTAHIVYAFISGPAESKNDRVRYALYSLGLPILQGGLSTILACVGTSTTDASSFRIFFKTMFLVITLGMLHSLVFLPVFLKIFIPIRTKYSEIDEMKEKEKEKDKAAEAEKCLSPMEAAPQSPATQEKKPYILTKTLEGNFDEKGAQLIGHITWTDSTGKHQESQKWTVAHAQQGISVAGDEHGEETTPLSDSSAKKEAPNLRMQPVHNPLHKTDAQLADLGKQLLPSEHLAQNLYLLSDVNENQQTVMNPLLSPPSSPPGVGDLQHMSVSVKFVYSGESTATPDDQQVDGQCAESQKTEQCADEHAGAEVENQENCACEKDADQMLESDKKVLELLEKCAELTSDFHSPCANNNVISDSSPDPDRETRL